MIRQPLTAAVIAFTCLGSPVLAQEPPLVARGNEPGWVLTLSADGLVFSSESGELIEMAAPTSTPLGLGTRHDADPGFSVEVLPVLCHDTMTGMPYPQSVSVVRGEDRLNGCGGDPLSLLQGDWRIEALDGVPVKDITLSVAGDRLTGQSVCNRYSSTVTLTGEAIGLGAPATTRMACEPEKMQAEALFLATLTRVTGFDIASDGALLLLGDGVELLRARR